MAMMHYLTTSGLHTSYRLEIGYYQPADAWHSAATSQEIVMPPSAIGKAADVDLATIPFHVAFQQLVNLFESDSKIPLAVAISRFEKGMLSSEQSNPLTAADKELLRDLGISLPQIAAAWRGFDETDAEKLVKLTRATASIGSDQPISRIRREQLELSFCYGLQRVRSMPLGISGGGALMRLWYLP